MMDMITGYNKWKIAWHMKLITNTVLLFMLWHVHVEFTEGKIFEFAQTINTS